MSEKDCGGTAAVVSGEKQKKKKAKKQKKFSPFRIKKGCLVAFRYNPKGNHVMLEHRPATSDNDDSSDEETSETVAPRLYVGDFSKESGFDSIRLATTDQTPEIHTLPDPVSTAHFCEMWTDPQPFRDDGLALVGSRVRVLYPKKAILKTYPTSKSYSIEGEVVRIVEYETQYKAQREAWRHRRRYGTLVEILVDNRGNRACESMPFLERTDTAVRISEMESLKESEKNELRIKGGPSKAVVKVLLCDISAPPGTKTNNDGGHQHPSQLPVGKWVIRKRVATKVLRSSGSPSRANTTSKSKYKTDEISRLNNGNGQEAGRLTPPNASVDDNDDDIEKVAGGNDKIATNKKQRRRTNKDFLASRYLGDGNDNDQQQEANWRWQVGRYCNPYATVLGAEQHGQQQDQQRPLSIELLERLSYNFVGQVVGVYPTKSTSVSSSGDSNAPSTLAMVSVQLLALPEHTHDGRMPTHDPFDAFDCTETDFTPTAFGCSPLDVMNHHDDSATSLHLRLPVEELLVVCRDVHLHTNTSDRRGPGDVPPNTIYVGKSYSFVGNTFEPGKNSNSGSQRTKKNQLLPKMVSNEVISSIDKLGSTLDDLGDYTRREGFIATRFVTKGVSVIDFALDTVSLRSFMYESSSKVVTKIPSRTPKKLKLNTGAGRNKSGGVKSPSGRKSPKSTIEKLTGKNRLPPAPVDQTFRPTSSRLLPYSVKKRKFNVSASDLFQWRLYRPVSSDFPEVPRNLRSAKSGKDGSSHAPTADDKLSVATKLTGRAARAKQRRMQRSVASMGVVVDTLAGRETQLRFDRSGIHDWGVFVDIDIKKGEMIVEYRGELIGNIMAEKREKEYEDAKIGSDYMFRIDDFTVCDATKQGNVARFINASCDPNCYTKIITLDNTKRIVIYAKKDIPAGYELCYDYRFDLEMDPSKRIPCGCGSSNCRGFLNWDKKLPEPSPPPSEDEIDEGNGHRVKRMKGAENEDDEYLR
mmetsp:Transcript_42289/g.101820  ORF Transcript_42289/g.101820 Transcript_42289/m.101820 type:complete len:978 (-) Transcript_42289:819-3752(-)